MATLRKRNVKDVLKHITATQNEKASNVLIRVDFNVPMAYDDDASGNGKITDDSRIRAAIPTINAVIDAGCNAILVSHCGRPKLVQSGADDDATKLERKKLSLRPAADRLAELLEKPVVFGEDCMGEKAASAVGGLPKEGGAVVLLENLRFYKDEEKNVPEFAK